jgi:hypothetical protein
MPKQPQWQPISQIPLVSEMISGMFGEAQKMYKDLLLARPKPHVMDDATVARVIDVYTTQKDDLWLYEGQLKHWQESKPTDRQEQDIQQMQSQLLQLREQINHILTLAEELQERTIERVLTKSDHELVLEILTGKWKPESHHERQN